MYRKRNETPLHWRRGIVCEELLLLQAQANEAASQLRYTHGATPVQVIHLPAPRLPWKQKRRSRECVSYVSTE